ncbi:MAG: bacillithiol biosynthesis BshC, partial [Bacteroidia bacterium]|nr:bacillithiol biosynthesis BshC [Bacteroidia bacterium]
KLKNRLFPSGLQERHDNIFEYISTNGIGIIDKMLHHCNPFDKKFKVFLMTEEQVQES